MLQRITSKKIELPLIYLVENKEDYEQLPLGIPYIVGNKSELDFIIIYLEFQTLLKSAKQTKIPIRWMDMLARIGYGGKNLRNYALQSGGDYWEAGSDGKETLKIDTFIEDQYLVDFDVLSRLKILPIWLDDIRSSIEANIIDEVIFDPTAFNKQLGMNVGAGTVTHHKKNLLILDVSGSIPNAVVMTITNLAKLMSKRFHADVIITGGQTYMVDYEDVPKTDFVKLAEKCGRNNEGEMYKAIVEQIKDYGTCICFGDNDNPGGYSSGKEIACKFTIKTLYSLHTDSSTSNIAGYARLFKPEKTHIVKDWVKTIN